MNKYTSYVTCLLFILFLTSCLKELMQKAYITNPPNICFFDSTKTTKIKFAGNLKYLENQLSYRLSDKWGISSNLLVGSRKQYGGDLGLVFYKNIKNKNYFELATGYGYFNSQFHMKHSINQSLIFFGPYYYQNINSTYHKLFLQPNYFISNNKNNLGFTLRFSASYFSNYNCTYVVSTYNGEYNNPPSEYSTSKFKNKIGFTFEPMFTIRFKNKKTKPYIQFGMCLATNIISTVDSLKKSNYDYYGPGPYIHYKSIQAFPLSAYFFINYCIEFNIKRK